jgi:hypothetical protein
MKRIFNNLFFKIFQILFLVSQTACQPSGYEKVGDSTLYYYAVEVNGTLCGYAEVSETPVVREGQWLIMQENNTRISMNLMDRKIETFLQITTFVDSSSLRPVSNEVKLDQGNVHLHARMNVSDTMVQFIDVNEERESNLIVTRDVIIENLLYYPYLVKDFYKTGLKEQSYTYLDEREQSINKKTVTFEGMDTLFLAGSEHICMSFTEVGNNGMVSKSWIDPETGLQLRNDIPGGGRNIFLADYRIKEMISAIDMDNVLFYTVDRVIPDFRHMTYMKVEVEINTVGDSLSVENLNRRGQRFDGIVENNFVIGTFELEPVRYDGRNAPGLPYDYQVPEDMNKYLEPENLIESDDIEIVHFAKQITKDQTDAWAAAVKLSQWVSDNVSGAIPGGGSAKGTMEMRQAECGGHSRLLTAMCRAVGIPARFVMGGMYVPDNRGFFGQHAWVEVFMGDDGWIPVDATIDEVDYIDAGHIRLGEKSTFHPKKMEIVEYRLSEF